MSLGTYPYLRNPNPQRLLQADEGPPPVTEDRISQRAFQAGFWARAAIETHTPYWGADLIEVRDEVWFIYRIPAQVSYLVYSKEEVDRLIKTAGGVEIPAVAQGFQSLIEIKIFCGGDFKIPDTYRWTSRSLPMPPTANPQLLIPRSWARGSCPRCFCHLRLRWRWRPFVLCSKRSVLGNPHYGSQQ